MEKAIVRNFTLEGAAFTLTGLVDKHGQTRYELAIKDWVQETMTFDALNQAFADINNDIEEVFMHGAVYEQDDDKIGYHDTGRIEVEEPHVVEFEHMWQAMRDADEV